MSLPKVIYGTGVSLYVVHVSNNPDIYEVRDKDGAELVCTCTDEERSVSIVRALASAAMMFELMRGGIR